MLQEANAAALSIGLRARTGMQMRRTSAEMTENVDYIRRELRRLGKMARSLEHRELAHFIDVATEVATELNGSKQGGDKTD